MGKIKWFSYDWRKVLAGVFESLLHVILVAICFYTSFFLTGLLDIAFKSKVIINPWISVPIFVILTLCPVVLSVALPKKLYHRTPGQCIVTWSLDHKGDLKPLILFTKILLVVVVVLFSVRWVTGGAFGSMAKKQLRALESMVVTLDPQTYYPAFDSLNNAAPYFRAATKSLDDSTKSSVYRIYRVVIQNPDTLKALSLEIHRIIMANQASLSSLDKALEQPKLLLKDYRNNRDIQFNSFRIKSDFGDEHPPNFLILGKICLLGALVAGYENDSVSCERYLNRAIGIARLEREEPTQLSGLVSVVETNDICDCLATLVKVVLNKSQCFLLVRKALSSLPSMVGITQNGEKDCFFWRNSFIDRSELRLINKVWPHWQHYCSYRFMVLAMQCTAPVNGAEDAARLGKECKDFLNTHIGIPAFGLMFATSPYSRYLRELAARASPDAVLIFAASVAYRDKYGTYPASLDELVPDYIDKLPQSPFDHKDYLFRTQEDSMEVYAIGIEGKHVPSSTIISW